MRYSLALASAMLATPVVGQDLRVITDTPVTHSLVSMVMGDVGTPGLLLDRGGDPHSFQMRPTQAQSLAEADLLFWMGEELTPWLARAITGSEMGGEIITLLDADNLHLLDFAQSHEDHDDHDGHDSHDDHDGHDDHGHDDDEHDDHGHDDHGHDDEHDDHGHDDHGHDDDEHDDHGHDDDEHDDHGHDDHGHDDHGHDDHGHDDHGHDDHGHDHAHDGTDPHAWMYPANVTVWLSVIAAELSENDPGNAETYAANAAAASEVIAALNTEVAETLSPVGDAPLVTFHDAYGYLAHGFGLNLAGTIALGDAAAPGAQRLSELRGLLQEEGAVCIFPEVNHSSRYVDVVVEGTGVRVGAELDPEGVMLEQGADLYPTLMRNLAKEIAACVAG